jgi:multidrug efflux pump
LIGRGAGYEMRQRLGTAVFSGMLGVTLFGIFLTPVFFFVIEWFVEGPLFHRKRMHRMARAFLLALDILTLGLFRLVSHVVRKLARRPAPSVGTVHREHVMISGNGEHESFSRDGHVEQSIRASQHSSDVK